MQTGSNLNNSFTNGTTNSYSRRSMHDYSLPLQPPQQAGNERPKKTLLRKLSEKRAHNLQYQQQNLSINLPNDYVNKFKPPKQQYLSTNDLFAYQLGDQKYTNNNSKVGFKIN